MASTPFRLLVLIATGRLVIAVQFVIAGLAFLARPPIATRPFLIALFVHHLEFSLQRSMA